MDYKLFITQIHDCLSALTEADKDQWIIDLLITVPEDKRSFYHIH